LTIVVAGRYITRGFLHFEEILFKSEDLLFEDAMALHKELSDSYEFIRVQELPSADAELEKAKQLLLEIYQDAASCRGLDVGLLNRLVEFLQ
jgi:hypothetical protein